MKNFNTDEYRTVEGRGEIAVGTWQHDELPKVGDTVKIDSVPIVVKGVECFSDMMGVGYKGKKIGIRI